MSGARVPEVTVRPTCCRPYLRRHIDLLRVSSALCTV
ncbi:putative leader peptide [Frankia sp. Cppng1_Ct_nod]